MAGKCKCGNFAKLSMKDTTMKKNRNGTLENPFSGGIDPKALEKFGPQVTKIFQAKKDNEMLADQLDAMVVGTMSRSRIISSLPRYNPNTTCVVRETSCLRFGLQAIQSEGLGLPHGVTPRKILAHIDTVIRSNKLVHGKRIYLGSSGRESALIFGFKGEGEDVAEFYKHINILANTLIFIRPLKMIRKTSKITTLGIKKNITVISNFEGSDLDFVDHGKHVVAFKPGWIEISGEYIEHVMQDSIPIDIKYYQSLKSALEMDLYPYFNLAVHRVEQYGENVSISKQTLFEELGPVLDKNLKPTQITSQKRNFISAVKSYLDRVKAEQMPFNKFDFEPKRTEFILTSGESNVLTRKKKSNLLKFIAATRTTEGTRNHEAKRV